MRFGKRTNASPRAFQTQTLHKWYLMRRTMRAAPPLTGHQFAKLPVYQQKLQTLRKDMIGLSDRVDRLKKRAGTINSSASSASMLIFRHFCRETPTAEAPRGARACSSTREASTSSIKGRSETACMSLYSIISIQQHHRDLMCHCESSARTRAHTRLSVSIVQGGCRASEGRALPTVNEPSCPPRVSGPPWRPASPSPTRSSSLRMPLLPTGGAHGWKAKLRTGPHLRRYDVVNVAVENGIIKAIGPNVAVIGEVCLRLVV